MYLIGYDIGSSSVKASLIEASTGKTLAICQKPSSEMSIQASFNDWAEQNPQAWWKYICEATQSIIEENQINKEEIKGIGIAYQMHGLVLVDQDQNLLRPAIIWCDSRAVEIGKKAFEELGKNKCLSHLLNSPGNFTASKLKWVKENEPEVYNRIYKLMLPGDYIAMKFSGEISTTISGLSEGMLWDFSENKPAQFLMDHYGISNEMIPNIKPTFSIQGKVNQKGAEASGLLEGTPITYRAGDQPNNALCLNVLNPGEVAATGGTSGVVYGVVDKPLFDQGSRVNGFAHVNYSKSNPRVGILLCINGAGIQYSWIRKYLAEEGKAYEAMEKELSEIPIGSDGLRILPFGNGAERMFEDKNIGAQINNLHFNRHSNIHFYRASLEGIAFSFVYGMQILKEMGLEVKVIRVGNDNLFQSNVFATTIATLMDAKIEMLDCTGAVGAAKASGIAIGVYENIEEALGSTEIVREYHPAKNYEYQKAYELWVEDLKRAL